MSDDDDDERSSYVAVPGFSIPFERVLEVEERPVNSDGSRTGSMFLTIDGCTFIGDGCKGDICATVGAPSVVITVKGPKGKASRYLVSAKSMVEVAIKAHKARKDWPDPHQR